MSEHRKTDQDTVCPSCYRIHRAVGKGFTKGDEQQTAQFQHTANSCDPGLTKLRPTDPRENQGIERGSCGRTRRPGRPRPPPTPGPGRGGAAARRCWAPSGSHGAGAAAAPPGLRVPGARADAAGVSSGARGGREGGCRPRPGSEAPLGLPERLLPCRRPLPSTSSRGSGLGSAESCLKAPLRPLPDELPRC